MYPTQAGAAEVLDTITQDILSKRRTHHSVVSASFGSTGRRKAMAPDRKRVFDVMSLVRRGIPVILAAGNSGGFVTQLPQKLADRRHDLWGPIVVGAVNNEGEKVPFSPELQYD
ncbi:MAG: hypothetical protein Q9221_003483 [Calogaya cf. arnoldii]